MTPLLPLFFALLQSPIDSAVGRFYDARWFDPAPAWVQRTGITRQATALLDVVAHADRDGLDPADYLTPTLESLRHRDLTFDDAWRLDTLLTRTFFLYARDVSYGRVEPALVDSRWTRSARSTDFAALLQLALDAEQVAPTLQDLTPTQEGYDTSTGVAVALRRFQELHGLETDGIVEPATRAQLRISAATRARQIALNLERGRWLPRSLGDRYIMVNSAAFSLALVDSGTIAFTARAVV